MFDFQNLSLFVNLLNFKGRVKTDDFNNPHCHRQELILVPGKLAQEFIIASKKINLFIGVKAL